MTKIRIADGLALPTDAVTQTFGILAKRGAGKSNAAAVLAEQMHAAGAQFVVVDPVGAWWGLRSSADGKGPGLSIAVLGGHHHDLPLDPGAGELVADLVVDERLSCVLDVSAFESESAKRRFLTAFANRLFRQKGRPGSGDPLHLFLEEADDYAPQVTGRGEGERGACLGAFQRLVKQGRARGIGCTIITQRSAAVNKDLLTQIETLIVLRTTAPNDRKAIEGWVKYHDVDGSLLASLSELAVGEAWVWSPSWLGIVKRVKLPRRTTYDSGATATGSSKSKPVATLADVDLTALRARMAATIEKAKADDPRELRKRITELERELVAAKKAEPKVERVEVPVVTDSDVAAVQNMVARALAGEIVQGAIRKCLESLVPSIKSHRPAVQTKSVPAPTWKTVHKDSVPFRHDTARFSTSSDRILGKKEQPSNGDVASSRMGRAMLTALAQRGPLTKGQILIFTGYRSSGPVSKSFAELGRHGLVVLEGAGKLRISDEGLEALGSYETLPTGAALRDRLVQDAGPMEASFLKTLFDAYPESISKGEILKRTGYASSGPVSKVFAKLAAINYAAKVGRGELRASEELFS